MKIKTKLRLGLGLLFFLILLLSSVAAIYMYSLKSDTQNILNDNYNSLVYAKGMMRSVGDREAVNVQLFGQYLVQQEANATEQGEKELNQLIRNRFEAYKKAPERKESLNEIRAAVLEVMEMNMQAIQIKSEFAEKTSDQAVLWILFTGAACIFIALNALLTLPSNIADPIEKLTLSIRQIAADNYSERVYLHKENEFGELANSFNTMAAKLEVYNNSHLAALMKQKSRMETLINNMHDAVLGLDEQMQVIFANHEAEKITGLSEEYMVGKNAKDLALHNDLIRLLIQDMLAADHEEQQQIRIMADAKEHYYTKEVFHIEIIPDGERVKQFVGHVIILRNITEFKELDAAKTRFIATVSHEFKTPISSMEMSLRLLKNDQIGSLNEEQGALVKSIDEDVHRLLSITKELLQLTQMESGMVQMHKTEVAPDGILKAALGSNQLLADAKGLQFILNVKPALRAVTVDAEKTIWVLANLITNAIHYSHEDSRIWISIDQTEEATVFKVKDEGIGIPAEYLDKVFERYFRVPGTLKEGTGLGLTIGKEFIEAQNGSLEARSEYGVGSEFIMTIAHEKAV